MLFELAEQVARNLARKKTGGRTLTLKVRYSDFTTITRSCTTAQGFFAASDILAQLPRLLAATEAGRRKIRLLGVTVANLCSEQEALRLRIRQLPLPFPPGRLRKARAATPPGSFIPSADRPSKSGSGQETR